MLDSDRSGLGLLVAVVGGYVAVVVGWTVAGPPGADAVAAGNVYVGVVVLAAVAIRIGWRETYGRVPRAELAALLVAGCAFGYRGLSTLTGARRPWYVDPVGDLAMVLAFGLLFYRLSRSGE